MGFKNVPIGAELKHKKYGWLKRINCPDGFKPNGEDLDKYFWYCNCDINEVLEDLFMEKFDMEYIKYKNELYKITSTGVYTKLSEAGKSSEKKHISIEEKIKELTLKNSHKLFYDNLIDLGYELKESNMVFIYNNHLKESYLNSKTKIKITILIDLDKTLSEECTVINSLTRKENYLNGLPLEQIIDMLFNEKEINEQTIDIEKEFNAGEYVYAPYKPKHNVTSNINQLPNSTNSKETKMNTNTITPTKRTKASIANTLKDTNLSAVKIATRITLGKTINKALAKKVKPKLPMMIRGYAEHPLFDILLANAFNIIVKQKFPENKKANYAADAMMEASMLTMAESFNLDEMLSDFLDGIKLPDLTEEEKPYNPNN